MLITGAGRGAGRSIALGFAGAGAKVAVNDVNPDAVDRVVAEIRESGGTADAFVADVANKMAIQTMIEAVLDRFGRLDALVNHAAVAPRADLLHLDAWDWDRTLGVNLTGAFLMIQSVGRWMAEHRTGSIVNIVPSDDGQGPSAPVGLAASRQGLIGLTQEAARALATYNIRVNAVCPGGCEAATTPMMGQGDTGTADRMARSGLPEEIVPLVLFLCSPQAASISGQAIRAVADG